MIILVLFIIFFYHMNRPTPSRSRYKNMDMVPQLICPYHKPSSKISQPRGTMPSFFLSGSICNRSRTYGMRKYRGSSKGVGRSVGIRHMGRSRVSRSVLAFGSEVVVVVDWTNPLEERALSFPWGALGWLDVGTGCGGQYTRIYHA